MKVPIDTQIFLWFDPFDRIIVAQATVEGMSLISKDEIFDQYLENQSVSRIG